MTAQQQEQSSKLKARWRIRRPILSVLLAAMVAAGLLWASLLLPRTFQASGIWTGNPDPMLNEIDHPPLYQLAGELLNEQHVATANLTVSSINTPPGPPGIRVTAKADSVQLAVDQVDEWLAQRAAHLTVQLADQLNMLSKQHRTQINQLTQQHDQLTTQIASAQSLIAVTDLPTHEQLAVQLSQTQQKLDQLNRQQAVYLGANRTLKGLLSRKKLLEQDLAMHTDRYGRGEDDPSVVLVKDQLAKLNVRIDVISQASKLDADADAKLAKVSGEIDTHKETMTVLRGKQQQLVEQSKAADTLGKLAPQLQTLNKQLSDHRQQLSLISEVLTGQIAWGHIQQASIDQSHVIWPTLGHIIFFAILGAVLCWGLLQLWFRHADRTMDHGMATEQSLAMPILGQVTFERRRHWLTGLCRLTVYPLVSIAVVLMLCVSLAAAYVNLHQPKDSTRLLELLASPASLQSLWQSRPMRHALPRRVLPVVIELPDQPVKQLSDKSSTDRI